MNELIKINYDTDQPSVSARDLHEGLEIKTAFKDWFPRMTDYGFESGKDFNLLKNERVQIEGNREVKREIIDYSISVDMAKQICMIQRTEKGRMYRQYFLDLEKAWNTPEQIMARALRMADKTIEEQKEQIKQMKPKALFADAVSASHTSILIGDLAKILRQNGVEIGQKRLFEWMRQNGYLISRNGADWNSPTQRSMERGLFEIKERVIAKPDGSSNIIRTTVVTGKGQCYFVNKFLRDREESIWQRL